MRRTICPRCGLEMRCLKNGMAIRYDSGRTYSGDRYICPECEAEVVLTAAEPLPDGLSLPESEYDVDMQDDQ